MMMRELLVVLVSGTVNCSVERSFSCWPCDNLLNNVSLLDIYRAFIITGTTSEHMTNTSILMRALNINARVSDSSHYLA